MGRDFRRESSAVVVSNEQTLIPPRYKTMNWVSYNIAPTDDGGRHKSSEAGRIRLVGSRFQYAQPLLRRDNQDESRVASREDVPGR